MASGNRVDELESRVKELEATVNGLTDELVESKVRIRELEDIVEDAGELDAVEGMGNTGSGSQPAERQQAAEQTATEQSAEADETVDTPKSEAPEGGDNEESESSDIIIA